ncbi:hypothetical protein SBADM41S_00774 [Streptomyces badius]
MAELLERDKDAFARAESLDTGKRLVESAYDMDDIANCFRYFGNLVAAGDAGRVVDTGLADVDSRIVYEPVGVCALARIDSAGELHRADRRRRPDHLPGRAHHPGPEHRADGDVHGWATDGSLGYFGAFLTASLASAYVMYGFDTASSLGEESHNPGRNAPRAILRRWSRNS